MDFGEFGMTWQLPMEDVQPIPFIQILFPDCTVPHCQEDFPVTGPFSTMRAFLICTAGLLALGSMARAQEENPQQQIADLERSISQKEQELRNLRRQVITIRRAVEASGQLNKRFYNNSIDLVEDMPESDYPKAGPEFTMERAKAKKWFESRLPGRNLELQATLYDVAVEGDGPYSVTVYCRSNNLTYLPKNGKNLQFDRLILFDTHPCAVMLAGMPGESFLSFSALDKEGSWIARYDHCATEEMEQLREMKGQSVTFKGRILYSLFQEKDVAEDTMGVVLSVSPMSVNDFLPRHTKKEVTRLEAQILKKKD